MNAIQLYDQAGKPLGFWICGKCRKVTLNPLYAFGSDKIPKNTQEAAEACCTDPICEMCGKSYAIKSYRTDRHCDVCESRYWRERSEQRVAKMIAKAAEVEDSDGMVYCEELNDNGWFDEPDAIREYLEENWEDPPDEWPEWCFASIKEVRQLDVGSAIDEYLSRLSEDGYEDMDLRPSKELEEAAEKYNRDNEREMTCWNVDHTRKIRIPRVDREGLMRCQDCRGDGIVLPADDGPFIPCVKCQGTGRVCP